MLEMERAYEPKPWEAALLVIGIILTIGLSIYFLNVAPHIPIILAIVLLIAYGAVRGVSYKEMERGMTTGAGTSLSAIYLFFFIGILVSSWLLSGTIPALMHASFTLVSPTFFLMTVFIVTGIVGISIGSSLTTVATLGVAFFGMGGALDISPAMTAGAIVSGAFFGDKMSPLSDTTTLASQTVGVDLFEHIRNMGWTTIPAFLISATLFAFLSPNVGDVNMDQLNAFIVGLEETGLIHWYSWIPLVLLFALTIFRLPAVVTLALSSFVAIGLSFFHTNEGLGYVMNTLFGGYVASTGNEAIDALLSKGGLMSMMFTIALVVLALSMGGLLFKLGIIQSLLSTVAHKLKSASSVIVGAALTAIGINLTIGEQYLSILLTGQSFAPHFEQNGLAAKNLSRVMEDAGTVINPLVPWSVCGIFIADALGISVMSYVPFAFFCLLSPVLTIAFGLTGKTLTAAK